MTETFKMLFPLPKEQQAELFANCQEKANQTTDVQNCAEILDIIDKLPVHNDNTEKQRLRDKFKKLWLKLT